MKIIAAIYDGYAVFSRARHDFRTFNGISVDGGAGVERILGQMKNSEFPPLKWIEIENVTYADIYNDWNGRKDKYGIHSLNQVTILEEKECPDTNSFEWKVEMAMWKTYGKDGGQPGTMIMLKDATIDHLEAILDTQNHISGETRKIIEHILKIRA